MQAQKTVDIVVPCFNPRKGWTELLIDGVLKLKTTLPEDALQSIIVVNDGSSSGISDLDVEKLITAIPEAKLIEYKRNRGKGYAVRTGVISSEADIQIYTDVDFPYLEKSMAEFYQILSDGKADVVIASRGDSYYNSLSGFRRILSKSLRWLNGLLFGLKIKDTQGGLKGFNNSGRNIFLKTTINRYLFDLEFVQKLSKTDLKIQAVNVDLKPDIVLPSPSPMILLKEIHNFIRLLIRR